MNDFLVLCRVAKIIVSYILSHNFILFANWYILAILQKHVTINNQNQSFAVNIKGALDRNLRSMIISKCVCHKNLILF